MGDFSNYASQGLQVGKTIPFEVTELTNPDGTHPIVHIEHLGGANPSVLEEMIARASAGEADEAEDQPDGRILKTYRLNQDAIIKHSARRLERVFFSDGTPATDAHIAPFIRAMPFKAFQRLVAVATNEQNFCSYPIAAKPDALAGK